MEPASVGRSLLHALVQVALSEWKNAADGATETTAHLQNKRQQREDQKHHSCGESRVCLERDLRGGQNRRPYGALDPQRALQHVIRHPP